MEKIINIRFRILNRKTEMLMAPSVKYLLKALLFSYTTLINNKKSG